MKKAQLILGLLFVNFMGLANFFSPPIATISGVVTDVSCFGMSDGVINITPSGGVTPYGFNWSNGASTEDINNLTAGSYTVTVWDGVLTIANFTVNEPPPILVNVSYSNYNGAGVSCSSFTDGWIDVSVSGGVPPYQYFWSNGQTTQDLLNLPGGIYDFTITDGISCEVVASSNANISGIPINWSYVLTLNAHSVLLPANNIKIDGSVVSPGDVVGAFFEQSAGVYLCGGYTVLNGAMTSIYLWTDDNLTMIKDGFHQGDSIYWYIWRASDSTIFNAKPYYLPTYNYDGKFYNNGMTVIDSLIAEYDENAFPSIVLPEPLPLLLSSELSDYNGYGVSSIGASDGSIELTIAGGTTPYSISWATGQSAAILQNLTAGSYTATVSDGNGCSVLETYTLTQTQNLIVAENLQHVSCYDGTDGAINLSVSGGVPPYYFSWSSGLSSQSISGLAAGSYGVTILNSNYPLPFFTGTYIINQPSMLTLTPSYSNYNGVGVSCPYSTDGWISVDINGGTSPYQFQWSTGATVDSVFLLSSGLYDLTVVDDNGCMVNTTSNNIETGVAFNWLWQNTGNNQSVVLQPIVKINNVLVSNGDMIGAFYEQSPTIFLCAGYEAYNGQSIAFAIWGDDQLTIIKEGFLVNDSVYWKIWRASDSTIFNAIPYYMPLPGNNGHFAANGLMILDSLIATFDENEQSTFVLTAPPLIQVNATLSSYNGYGVSSYGATNGSINISIQGGVSPYTFNWLQPGLSGNSVQNLSAGTYGISGSDANGCAFVYNFQLTQPAQLLLFPGSYPASCYGGSDGSLELNIYGGISPYKVDWWDGGTEILNGNSTLVKNNLAAGNYGVTVMDASGWPAPNPRNWFDSITGMDHTLIIPINVPITIDGIPISTGDYISVFYDSLGTLKSGAGGLNLNDLIVGIGLLYEGPSKAYQIIARGKPMSSEFGFVNQEPFNWRLWRASDSLLIPLTPVFETFSPDGNNYVNNGISLLQSLTGSIWESYPGAISTTTIFVPSPDPIEMDVISNSFDCNASNPLSSGYLDIIVAGGQSPYTFNWSNGSTTQNLSNLPTGNYFLTVTDANGCTRKFSESVYVDTVPSFTLPTNTSVCTGTNYTLLPTLDNQLCFDFCKTCTMPNNYCDAYAAAWNSSYLNSPFYYEYIASVSLDGQTNFSDLSSYSDYSHFSLAAMQRGQTYSLSVAVNVVVPLVQENLYTFIDWNRDGDFNDPSESQVIAVNQTTSFLQIVLITVPANASIGETKMRIILKGGSIPGPCDTNFSNGEVEDYKIEIYDVIACTPQFSWTGPGGFTSTASEVELNNIVGANEGNYSFSVSYPNSCTSSGNIFLTVNPSLSPLTGINYLQNISCNGYANGSIGLYIPNYTPFQISFLWSNGSTNGAIGGLSAGLYSVTVTNQYGCSSVFDTTIIEPPVIVLNTILEPVACQGMNTGSIDLSVSGGVSPYIYNWSNGETTQDISNLTAGTYNVTIIDDFNCYKFLFNTITEPTALMSNGIVTHPSCSNCADGTILVSPIGGVSPYSILWSNGQSVESISNLSSGFYYVSLMDDNGCSLVDSFELIAPPDTNWTPCPGVPTITDYDGNVYNTVLIGSQCWMKENLRVTHYSDGYGLVDGSGLSTIWWNDTNKYYFNYNGDTSLVPTYGRLYNWNVVMNGESSSNAVPSGVQGICPFGWHVPSDEEWKILEGEVDSIFDYPQTEWDGSGERGYNVGQRLKSTTGWLNNGNGNDQYGFSALPSGLWYAGDFFQLGLTVSWWTSTEYNISTNDSWRRRLIYDSNLILRQQNQKSSYGFSVRCLKDPDQANTPPNWNYTPTGNSHYLIIPDTAQILMNGNPVASGDYLGVFYDSAGTWYCGGYVVWADTSTYFPAFGSQVGVYTGFESGEEFTWMIWDQSEDSIFQVDATYIIQGFPNTNIYTAGGVSAIASLSTGEVNLSFGNYLSATSICAPYLSQVEIEVINYGANPVDTFNIAWYDTSGHSGNVSFNMLLLPGDTSSVVVPLTDTLLGQAYIELSFELLVDNESQSQDNHLVQGGISLSYPELITTLSLPDCHFLDDGSILVQPQNYLGNSTILWSTSDTSLFVDSLVPGIYSFTFSDANCLLSDTVILEQQPVLQQSVHFPAGWSLFSSYLNLADSNLVDIFAPALNYIIVIRNSLGYVYWPYFGLNQIGDFTIGEGYQLNSNSPFWFVFESCEAVVPESTVISLPQGWSIIAYLRQNEMDVEVAISSIVADVKLIKDYNGNAFWPYFNLNMIGNFVPGQGYQIKMAQSRTFSYPANSINSTKAQPKNPLPQHYPKVKNTGQNMTLGIPLSSWREKPQPGDEVGVFTESGLLVGSGVFDGGNMAITVWGDDETTPEIDGLLPGEAFSLRLIDATNLTASTDLSAFNDPYFQTLSGLATLTGLQWIEGDNTYQNNKIAIIGFLKTIAHDEVILFQNTPNPFTHETEFSFYLPEKTRVGFIILSLLGEVVEVLVSGEMDAGKHSLKYQTKQLPAGSYYYRLETPEYSGTKKMMIMR